MENVEQALDRPHRNAPAHSPNFIPNLLLVVAVIRFREQIDVIILYFPIFIHLRQNNLHVRRISLIINNSLLVNIRPRLQPFFCLKALFDIIKHVLIHTQNLCKPMLLFRHILPRNVNLETDAIVSDVLLPVDISWIAVELVLFFF